MPTPRYEDAASHMAKLNRVNDDLRATLEGFRVKKGLDVSTLAAMLNFEVAMYQRTLAFSVNAFHEMKEKGAP